MKKIFSLLLICTFYLSNAQQVQFTSGDFPGIAKKMANTNDFYLPLSDNEFLFAGGNGNSHDVTLVKSDNKCKTLWTVPAIQGYQSAAILGKNIVVFSADNRGNYTYRFINSVRATLMDSKSGKIIAEKDIPVYSGKMVTDIHVLTDSARNFKYLILRSTEENKAGFSSRFTDGRPFGRTANMQAIRLDSTLTISANTLDVTAIQKAEFIGCTSNNDNDIFVASIENNRISANRYSAGGSKITATVSAACNFENDVATMDGKVTLHQNKLWLACKFDEVRNPKSFVTGVFNFENKKGIIQQDIIDYDYLKQYAQKISSVDIVGTEFYNDKFIVIKEFNTVGRTYQNTPHTVYGPVIVSVYSSTLKQLKEVTADENFDLFYSIPSAYFKLLNNQLFIFYNETKWRGVQTKYQVINLDNFSVSAINQVETDAKYTAMLYGPGMVWFEKTALLPYASQYNPLHPNKIITNFRAVGF